MFQAKIYCLIEQEKKHRDFCLTHYIKVIPTHNNNVPLFE